MGFFSGIAKYLLFFFNLLILIAAVALIAVGVIYKVNNVGLDIKSVSTYAIIVGVIIGLVAFFGCCGAIKESSCLLTTYAVIMIAIFIAQVVLVVFAFLAIRNGNLELDKQVRNYLRPIYENLFTNQAEKDIVDTLQKNFECCGIDGSTNYTLVVDQTTSNLVDSCCEETPCTVSNAYKSDCIVEFFNFIESNAKIIGGIAIGVAVVEIFAAILAFCITNSVRGRRQFV